MPNWVTTSWAVCLPKKNTKRFLGYFLDWSCDKSNVNHLKGRFFYRTFIDEDSIEIEDDPSDSNLNLLRFCSDTAWALENLMIPHTGEDGINHCVTIEWVCRDCEVVDLQCDGDEPGMGFREHICFDPKTGIGYETENVTPCYCDKCNSMWYAEDYDEGWEGICPFCEEKLDEEDNGNDTNS